ncbi:MAG: quinol:cytochrome C oxidoreductase [Bacteroidota bacterium]
MIAGKHPWGLKQGAVPFGKVPYTVLMIGILINLFSYAIEPEHSLFSLVMSFAFAASVGLGALFWVAIEYLTSAVWSVAMRRVFEFLAGVIPFLIIFALPLLLNLHEIFIWTHKGFITHNSAMLIKLPYLNAISFTIRTVVILAIWGLFYVLMTRNSLLQDTTHEQNLTKRNIKLSAAFMPILGVTLTLFAIDWLMSLSPSWYSTIFGVYYFAGAALAAMAMATLIIVTLNERGRFPVKLSRDHYYNLGGLIFAFTNFWAYIAFSQFMLIWYGNLPEETAWIVRRMNGSWAAISIILVIVHFLVPFVGLITRSAKMKPQRLISISICILLAHALDIYWLVMPVYSEKGAPFNLSELSFLLISVGFVFTVFAEKSKRNSLIPVGDPKLKKSLEFQI